MGKGSIEKKMKKVGTEASEQKTSRFATKNEAHLALEARFYASFNFLKGVPLFGQKLLSF